jgi:hypothetical protein
VNIIKNENKLTLGFILLISSYICYLIFSNISKGFDITDESFYILNYSNYNDLPLMSMSLFRYPIAFLNYFVSDNLPILRFLSVLILILSSMWLGYEFQKYINIKFDFKLEKTEIINIILVVTLGSLSYYKFWLFTPSYNWLGLLTCILFYAIFFNIINTQSKNIFKYLLLSLILVLSFLAKPTTTIILIIIGCLFLFSESKKINNKSLFFTVLISSSLFLFFFLLATYGSINHYSEYLFENFSIMNLMESGHSLNDMLSNYILISKKFFFEKFIINTSSVYYKYLIIISIGLFILISLRLKDKNVVVKSFNLLVKINIIIYALLLIFNLFQLKRNAHLVGFYLIEFIMYLFVLIIIYYIFVDKIQIKSFLKKFIFIFITSIFGIIAYVFGTNTNIIYKLTETTVFFFMIIIIIGLFFEKKLNIRFIQNIINISLVIVILLILIKGYEYPYKRKGINEQKYPVVFIDREYTLYVDEKNKTYIESLKKLSFEYNFKESNYLLDMTGETPGANVILNARFFSLPWLIGGYPGSNKLVYKILKDYIDLNNSDKLKKAWILTTKDGKRALDLEILNDLNLNFPKNYQRVGTLITSHRNEIQELWIPNK